MEPSAFISKGADFKCLENGKQLIRQKMDQESKACPDLGTLLESNQPQNYFFQPYSQYEEVWKPQVINASKSAQSLPEELGEALRSLQCSYFMGIFPEIHRVWIAIDNQVFFWNYVTNQWAPFGSGFDQIVVTVGLVQPKDDVFLDKVKNVLVVATRENVSLYGVSFENDNVDGDIFLHKTEFVIPTPDFCVTKIIGTDNGRIFLGSRDGNLYEIGYNKRPNLKQILGLQNKCHVTNRSTSMLTSLMPDFIRLLVGMKTPLIDIAFDSTRNLFFTLSADFTVHVYHLGVSGKGFSCLTSRNILTAAEKFTRCSRVPHLIFAKHDGDNALKPVSISVKNSQTINAVVTTNTGVRIFLGCTGSAWLNLMDNAVGNFDLNIKSVRMPPCSRAMPRAKQPLEGFQPSFDHKARERATQAVHKCFMVDGTCLMADGHQGEDDVLLALTQDYADHSLQGGHIRSFQESVFCFGKSSSGATGEQPIQGKVMCIVEDTPKDTSKDVTISIADNKTTKSTFGTKRSHRDMENTSTKRIQRRARAPIVRTNELASQFNGTRRSFLVLTTAGLYKLVKMTPLDQLCKIIADGNDQELRHFFDLYGRDEACAMLFAVACGAGQSLGSGSLSVDTPWLRDHQSLGIKQAALEAVLTLGGTASSGDNSSMFNATRVVYNKMGYSGSHDGLLLFLQRSLTPIWNTGVFSTQKNGLLKLELSLDTVSKLLKPLSVLLKLVETTFQRAIAVAKAEAESNVPGVPTFQNIEASTPQQTEDRSIYALFLILQRCVHLLKFVELLHRHSMLPHLLLRLQAAAKGSKASKLGSRVARKTIKRDALQRQLEDIVDAETLMQVVKAPFSDLVSTPHGDAIVRALVVATVSLDCTINIKNDLGSVPMLGKKSGADTLSLFGSSTIGSNGQLTNNQSLLRSMHDGCSSFFSQSDVLLFQALQQLAFLQKNHSSTNLSSERRRSIRDDIMLRMKKAIQYWSTSDWTELEQCMRCLADVCVRLTDIREYNSVIELALSAAYQVSGKNVKQLPSEPTETEKRQIAIRCQCYDIVLSLVRHLVHPVSIPGASNKMTLSADERSSQLDSLLRFGISFDDVMFHEALYNFLLEINEETRLILLPSRHLESFLRRRKTDPDLLCRFLLQHGKPLQAAHIMASFAQGNESCKLDVRLHWLCRAISAGKSVGTLTQEASDSLTYWCDLRDTAIIQKKILKRLRAQHAENERSHIGGLEVNTLNRLENKLLSVQDLYVDYANKYELWDCCLLLLTSAGEPQHVRVAEACWLKLLQEVSPTEPTAWMAHLRQRLSDVGSVLLAPEGSTPVFSLDYLCKEAENLVVRNELPTNPDYNISWLPQVLREIGLSHAAVFNTYDRLLSSARGQSHTRLHLLCVISEILRHWVSAVESPRCSMPALEEFSSRLPTLLSRLDEYRGELHILVSSAGVSPQVVRQYESIFKELSDKISENKFKWPETSSTMHLAISRFQ